MIKIESMNNNSLEEFYQDKLNWVPENLNDEIGHFNVFKIGNFVGHKAFPTAFSRKNFYKIKLIIGKNRCYYADKTIEIKESAMLFANPLIPYHLENLEGPQTEYFCIFTEAFFHQFGHIKEYPIFKPEDHPVYFLNEQERKEIISIYEKMEEEIKSDYEYKYDVLRNLVYELIHKVMKMKPAAMVREKGSGANLRIVNMFRELLDLQFPLEHPHQEMKLRRAQDFASHLSIHVNHLNRAVKIVTGKTTSNCISERIIQEAKMLLKHSNRSVSEIAYNLRFDAPTHFISFFRKQTDHTPASFRQLINQRSEIKEN